MRDFKIGALDEELKYYRDIRQKLSAMDVFRLSDVYKIDYRVMTSP